MQYLHPGPSFSVVAGRPRNASCGLRFGCSSYPRLWLLAQACQAEPCSQNLMTLTQTSGGVVSSSSRRPVRVARQWLHNPPHCVVLQKIQLPPLRSPSCRREEEVSPSGPFWQAASCLRLVLSSLDWQNHLLLRLRCRHAELGDLCACGRHEPVVMHLQCLLVFWTAVDDGRPLLEDKILVPYTYITYMHRRTA